MSNVQRGIYRLSSGRRGVRGAPLGGITAGAGLFADLASIVELFSKGWIGGMIAGGAGALFGGIRLLLLRGQPVGRATLMPVAIVAIGCLAFAFCLQKSFLPESGPGSTASGGIPVPTTTVPSSTPASPTSTTTMPTAAPAEFIQVRLKLETGVDVDGGETEGRDAQGPSGAIDLYLGPGSATGAILANGSAFFRDQGPDSEARERCAKATTSQRNPQTQVFPLPGFPVLEQYCFLTSDRKVGWMQVVDSSGFSYPPSLSSYVVLNVRVWK